nr:OmpA family protein [Roseicella sp. DB1501]
MPPIAAPVSPRPPARTYLVFFDSNSAILTSRAKEIIAEAAQNWSRIPGAVIDIAGHTDTREGRRGAQALSEARANAVVAEFKAQGVPEDRIRVAAYGARRLLIPTRPNVAEAQNRRVEIVLKDREAGDGAARED